MALESICLSWVESFGDVFQSGFCALRLFQQPAKADQRDAGDVPCPGVQVRTRG